MQLREGYKQTEVGVIPENWKLATIKEVVDLNRLPSGIYKDKNLYGHGSQIIKLGDVFSYDYFQPDSAQRVKVSNDEIANYRVKIGDIFIALASVKLEGVGKVMLVTTLSEDTVYDHNVALIRLLKGIEQKFVFYLFKSYLVRKLVASRATQVGTTFLKASTILEFPIALPSNAEQRAIASALSDVDALLAAQDKLIAKKRDIKQASMQKLLMGKQRLPGFTGEWEVKLLGDIAEIVMGQSPSSSNYNVKGLGLPLIQGNADIADRKTIRRIFTTEITKRGKCGDILMSVRAPVGEISLAVFDVCLGRGVCAIRYTNDYLYHYLISQEPGWARLSKGSTFDSVNSADVKALEVCLPTDADEQIAIASILADMDADLTALEQQRDKTRDIKQGMMQELLTGRIRLV